MALVLTINRQDDPPFEVRWRAGSLRIDEQTNGRMTFSASIYSADGSYVPARDEIVILSDGATVLFGGYVTYPESAGLGGQPVPRITTKVDAVDWNAIGERRYVLDGYAGIVFVDGQTARDRVLLVIAGYLAEFGVSSLVWPTGIGDGAVLGPATYHLRQVQDVLTEIGMAATPNGLAWKITGTYATKVLTYYVPGLAAAPTPVWEGDIVVKDNGTGYANNILVSFGDGPKDILDESHAGDGSTRIFPVLYPITDWLASGVLIVTESGVDVASYTIGPQADAGTAAWTLWSDMQLHQNASFPVVSAAGSIRYSYRAQFPMVIRRQNLPEMAIHSTWEEPISLPDVFDLATAQAQGDAALLRSVLTPPRVVARTRTPGIHPGQGLTLVEPARHLNSTFLVESVSWGDRNNRLFYTVTMVEGATVVRNWKDYYKGLGAGSGTGSVGSPGAFVVLPASPGRASYPLGGSMFAGVRSLSGPAKVSVGGNRVQLDTVAIGGASVTAVATCRVAHAGITVIPVIVDVSHGNTVIGTGAAITTVTPTTVVFTVTPAAGVSFCELWLLPSAIGQDVFGSGYVELGR